jgi:transketolase
MSPGDDWEAAEATEAIAALPGTTYLRLDRAGAPSLANTDEVFELGKARCLRDGHDITIAVTGGVLDEALRASLELERQGIHCRVLSFHTVKPLDHESLMEAARETGGIITVEEHTIIGGLGSAVAETLLESGVVPRLFHRVGLHDRFSSVVGSQSYLRDRFELNSPAIVRQVQQLLARPYAIPERRAA